ncbi:DNA polymerase III subunit chi [Roseateles oligotrophus]|uniref:DNA polymerase III subunit chi n=1 Tax=Roseateles oligotrophus TaxID=1769250 RepID=A0ABT2YF81_9BURK|nr:DNA polymerase III subunit chi [Roseateles oligotrophus]MCV2368708.1 DNA polymerase III subunit chi [Roseateles oligotrophus]
MTQVSFYTGVPDRLAYVCRLLRKAQQSGARVGVCGPPASLRRLDAALWVFEPAEFVPHLNLSAAAADPMVAAATPILLIEHALNLGHREVLLNLGLEMPQGFDQFQRLLEVVSQDAEQVQAGRRRYRLYEELGISVNHHKVSA